MTVAPGKRPKTIAAVVLGVFLVHLPVHVAPTHFLADDTYFYLQVAFNILEGYGSTFHRITPTNGYHPLWQLLSVVSMALAGGAREVAIHVMLLMQSVIATGVGLLYWRLMEDVAPRIRLVGVAILALYFLTGVYGSEAHINGLAVLAALLLFRRALRLDRTADWLYLGAALGLSTLARLDSCMLAVGVVLTALAQATPGERLQRLRNLVGTTLAYLVVVAPYLLWNYTEFGYLMPISGAIKSSLPIVRFHLRALSDLGLLVTTVAILVIPLALFSRRRDLRLLVLPTAIATLLHSIYLVFLTDGASQWSWYYVLGVLTMAMTAPVLLDMLGGSFPGLGRWIRRGAPGLAGLLLLLAVGRGWIKVYNPYYMQSVLEPPAIASRVADHRLRVALARRMNRMLPKGTAVVVYDGPGTLAYFSDLRILPVDGLMNDFAYNDEILKLGINRYLGEKGIRYYFGPVEPPGLTDFTRIIYAPLYGRPAGSVRLRSDRIELVGQDHPGRPPVLIWRLVDSSSRYTTDTATIARPATPAATTKREEHR